MHRHEHVTLAVHSWLKIFIGSLPTKTLS